MQRALGVTGLFLVLGLEVVGWSVLARGVRAARLRVPRARGVAGRVLGGLATTLLHVAHAGIAWRALAW
ncbi:MAG: hypothetical protein FJ104_04125 [Deltaproteobacteria bacterium]|nr:hypothetical protein [Deltaproteobacteria bacterium]